MIPKKNPKIVVLKKKLLYFWNTFYSMDLNEFMFELDTNIKIERKSLLSKYLPTQRVFIVYCSSKIVGNSSV